MSSSRMAESHDSARMRVGAVLLAAGQGSRLGGYPKALLQRQGIPLIHHHLRALDAAGVNVTVVVTGFYHQAIEPELASFSVEVVRNPDPARGQPSSVRLGMQAIGADFDAIIMMLCDQPLINANDIKMLLEGFCQSAGGEILVPQVNGQRGNPIVVSGQAMAQMLGADETMYCRRFMDENPGTVCFMQTENAHFIADLDTPADLAGFEARWGQRITKPSIAL